MGFTLGIVIVVQIVTGLFISFHYSSDINEAYYSVFFLIREIYYGWSLRFLHSSGASFVFLFVFLHIGRSLFYGSFFYNPNTWFSGILILLLLMGIAFLGYVLPFGQMSFWGATVITNLLSPFPCLIEWICGGYCVNSPTLKRFFVFHFVFPYVTLGTLVLHIYFLHFHSSNNPSKLITNNRISFFPFIFIKDLVFVSGILYLYFLQTHLGISSLSHPDNALEACSLLTPLHIVPEWYFLCQYAMLKAVPNKNAGFIILLTSILSLFLFGEIRNLSTFIKFMDCKNGFSITFFFLLSVCILWIGAQFPQEIYLSYARILTLHYYCSLFICILLT
jgi:ubiquinol-cytochrome c reductase cytochrome b subunit